MPYRVNNNNNNSAQLGRRLDDEEEVEGEERRQRRQSSASTTAVVLHAGTSASSSPFESFLTAAFGTFLAVLLAWRFLLSADYYNEERSTTEETYNKEDKDKRSFASGESGLDSEQTSSVARPSSSDSNKINNSLATKSNIKNNTINSINSYANNTGSNVASTLSGSSQRPLTLTSNAKTPMEAMDKGDGNCLLGHKLSFDDSGTEADDYSSAVDTFAEGVPPCLQRYCSTASANGEDAFQIMSNGGAHASLYKGIDEDIKNGDLMPNGRNERQLLLLEEEDLLLVANGNHDDDSSSSERGELGVLPAYLDTITEEDTDDLNTNSSGRSSPKRISRLLYIQEELKFARNFLSLETKRRSNGRNEDDEDDENLSTTSNSDNNSSLSSTADVTTPNTPRNASNLELNCFQTLSNANNKESVNGGVVVNVDDASRSTSISNGRQRLTDAEESHASSTQETGSSSSPQTVVVASEISKRDPNNDDDALNEVSVVHNNSVAELEFDNSLRSTGESTGQSCLPVGNNDICDVYGDAGVTGGSVEEESKTKNEALNDRSRFYNSSYPSATVLNNNNNAVIGGSTVLKKDYYYVVGNFLPISSSLSSPSMEYDLRKASRRFERYGHVYKDAPKSGMEEFDPKALKNSPSVGSLLNNSSTGLNESDSNLLNRRITDINDNALNGSTTKPYGIKEKEKTTKQMAPDSLNLNRDKFVPVTTHITRPLLPAKDSNKETGSDGHSATFHRPNPQPAATTNNVAARATAATTNIHSTTSSVSPKYCVVCGARVYQYLDFKCRNCPKKRTENNNTSVVNNNNNNRNNAATRPTINNNYGNPPSQPKVNVIGYNIRPEPRLDDYNSNWSFSDDDGEMSSTSTTGSGRSRGLVVATATSKAIINDPAGQKHTSLIAAATANAVSKNPYVALARATASAASKVSEVVQHAVDPDQQGKVSLVVSSTICASGRDLKRASRENVSVALERELSSPERTPDMPKKQRPIYYGQGGVVSGDRRREATSSPYGRSHEATKVKVGSEQRQTNVLNSSFESSTYYRRENVKMAYEPQPERIYPPSVLREVQPQHKIVSPQHVSSEHLQKLVEDPYFTKSKSREKLQHTEQPNVKSKTSPSSVPLSERNVNLWSTMPENTANSKQNLMRWRNSMNLAENEELRQLMENDRLKEENYRARKKAEAEARLEEKLLREKRNRSQEELNEEIRKIRRNKYKAKIDKAKREYLDSKASVSDLYKDPEEFERKFKVSIENVRMPEAPRGPYLEYLGKSGSLHSIKVADVKPYYYKPDSLYDNEYESIVQQAESLWAPYKRRNGATKDNLYTNARSTGYLETNFDYADEIGVIPGSYGVPYETDLDEAMKDIENYQQPKQHESRSRTKSMTEVKKKSRGEQIVSTRDVETQARARSADYLVDKRAREEIEPPENQLKKILGDKDETELSEHELRFRKSTEKLPVPDWYLNSDYCPGGKLVDGGSRKSTPTFLNESHQSSKPTSPESVAKSQHHQYVKRGQSPPVTDHRAKSTPPASYKPSDQTRYVSPWTYGGKIAPPPGAERPLSPDTAPRYTPQKPPAPPKSYHQNGTVLAPPPRSTSEPRTFVNNYEQRYTTATKTSYLYEETQRVLTKYDDAGRVDRAGSRKPVDAQDPYYLPKDFFARYRDEIEELRKSRTHLYGPEANNGSDATIIYRTTDDDDVYDPARKTSSGQQGYNYNLPVATVRPSSHFKDVKMVDSSSGMSTDVSSPSETPPNRTRALSPYRQQPVIAQSLKPFVDSGLTPTTPAVKTGAYQTSSSTTYDEYSVSELITSTPYLAHKPAPPQKFNADERAPDRYLSPRSSFRQARQMPGWTVSAVPADWNVPGQRESVVIEVSDQFFDSAADYTNRKNKRSGVPQTLEEVLDALLNLPTKGQRRLSTLDESSASLDTPIFPRAQLNATQVGTLGIYTHNGSVMEKCKNSPENAEELLQNETLWVRCAHCHRVRQLSDARYRFVSCHYCYTYYCSRSCRKSAWAYHKEQCDYARVSTMCKDVIFKVRQDPDAQWQMSRVARQNYSTRGRGSVNFRFRSPYLANRYIKGGWAELILFPGNYLHYNTVPELVDANKETNLINLCRRYDPQQKFVLSVSIMAEIEEVPETPPPEREQALAEAHQQDRTTVKRQLDDGASTGKEESGRFERSKSVPSSKRKSPGSTTVSSSGDDARSVLKSVLRSMENIAPGPVYISSAQRSAHSLLPLGQHNQSFERNVQERRTVTTTYGKPGHYNSSPLVWNGPSIAAGNEDADETEV